MSNEQVNMANYETVYSVEYENQHLHQEVVKDANKKFDKNSYVKSLWILKEYKRRGGKVNYSGDKKPSKHKIEKQIKGKEIVLNVCMAVEKKKNVHLNKPFRTPDGPKKFAVYVKNDKGNIVLVRFGDPHMEIKRDDPARRKSFRARHHCDNPGPKWKAQYWACQTWRSDKSVKQVAGDTINPHEQHDWENLPPQDRVFSSEGLPPFDIEEIESSEDCLDCYGN